MRPAKFFQWIWLCGVLAGGVVVGAPASASAQEYVLVVHADNPVTTLTKNELAALFLKKTTRWSNGKPVVPVEQGKSSKLRDVFAKAILGQSAASLDSYWQTQIFSGNNVPPITRPNDADILALVRSNQNAIGYVSAKTPLGSGVKAVVVK